MIHRLMVVVASLVLWQPCVAGTDEDLYRAQSIVTGTEEPERTRGFRQALAEVFVKLTGDPRLRQDPRLQPVLDSPHRFVARFEYEDRMKGIPVHDEQGTRERPHYLRVIVDGDAVDAELQRLGLLKWPAERPTVGVWVEVQTANERYVLSADGPEGYGQRAVLMEAASALALPIRLPPSGNHVSLQDMAMPGPSAVESALGGADALLIGVLSVNGEGYWNMTWSFSHASGRRDWALSGVTFDQALKSGLDMAALVLSRSVDRP